MATGGKLARSQVGASDAIYDFMCTPCAKNGKNTEAEHYCAEYQTYFCKRCVDFHNTFLSSHTLLDKTAMKSKKSQTTGAKTSTTNPLLAITCEEHPGKMIEMFCGHHDVVCCTVCIAVKHRSCDGVEYIPTIARGTAKGAERQKAKTTLEKVRQELQLLMSKRKNNLTLLNKQYDDCVKDIKYLKKRIIDRVNELERKSVEEVNSRHKQTAKRIETDISSIDDMLEIVDTQLNKVNQISNDNEAELFVHIKQSQRKTLQCEELVSTFKCKGDSSIEYILNRDIESALSDIQSLVSVEIDDTGAVTPYTATRLGTYDIKIDSDSANHYIYGCCLIDNNQTVITDFSNNTLKRLNDKFKVSDSIGILGNPYGVCNTGQSEVAVTLQVAKKVQFVSVRDTLSLTHSFSVGDTCRGICCSKGHLYICCEGGPNDGPGRVKVFDMSGSELYVIRTDQSGQNIFSFPRSIAVAPDGSPLYFVDFENRVISVDIKGNQFDNITVFTDTVVKGAVGTTVDDRGNIFACGCNSNNVIQIDRRGNILRTLLSQTDGIKYPITLHYLKNPRRLLVCEGKSGLIKLYKLTSKLTVTTSTV